VLILSPSVFYPVGCSSEKRARPLRLRSRNPSVGILRNLSVGFDRPLKLAPGNNLLKLLISNRGRSRPTNRFHRIPILGSHQILSVGWIQSDSLTWGVNNLDKNTSRRNSSSQNIEEKHRL